MAKDPSEKELDRLYGLPLDEFTAERDALARRLRSEGSREEADAVKRLKKPSLPAWGINQLTRRHGGEVRGLLEAGESLRAAHEHLLAGGKQTELRDAAEHERKVVTDLVRRVEPLLSEGGSPSTANLERVRSTLHAAAGDEALRAELEAGRVVRDREATGLGFAAGAPAASGPSKGGRTLKGSPKEADRREAAARRRALRDARARSERATEKLRLAKERLERARKDAEAARRELKAQERKLAAAEQEADDADAELRELTDSAHGRGA